MPAGAISASFLIAMAVLAREFRSQVAAERKPDQVEAIEPELSNSSKIVHDVVVQVGERGIVS